MYINKLYTTIAFTQQHPSLYKAICYAMCHHRLLHVVHGTKGGCTQQTYNSMPLHVVAHVSLQVQPQLTVELCERAAPQILHSYL